MTYEEAKMISDDLYEGTDYVLDYDDAYVFLKKDATVFGGKEGPIVVIKETGDTVSYYNYLLAGDHELLREFNKQ